MASSIDRSIPGTNTPLVSAEIKGNFNAAANDIEALQSGKEDTGVAAGAVAAHDASGTAHGGVQADHAAHVAAGNPHTNSASLDDLSNHKASGGTEHPVATTGAGGEGFAPALSGVATEYLNGTGAWSTPAGGGGSPLTTKGDLYSHDTGDARLPVGTDGQMLYADSAQGIGLRWGDAPTGTGDVTSVNNTVDDEVQVGDGPPKGIKGAGFTGANVARLDVASDFAVQPTFSGDPLAVRFSTFAAGRALQGFSGNRISDSGIDVSSWALNDAPNDIQAPVRSGVETLDSATLGGTWTPRLSVASDRNITRFTGATAFQVQVPAAADTGVYILSLASGLAVTFAAGWEAAAGNEGTGARLLMLVWDGVTGYPRWAN